MMWQHCKAFKPPTYAPSPEACCAGADPRVVTAWTWLRNATPAATSSSSATALKEGEEGGRGGGGSCQYWSNAHPDHMEPPANATTGITFMDPVTKTTDFVDLYNKSCLNGWTMGNVAATATDVTRFYWALFNDKLISKYAEECSYTRTELLYIYYLSNQKENKPNRKLEGTDGVLRPSPYTG